MGDGLKLSKDKRHRSSSSIVGVVLEGTRSERKLDIRASIPEVDDQFALADSRCDELQEKLDLVKGLKRKKKLKKRSMTRVTEPQPPENVPFISVRTQPKKKVSQQAARLRRLEPPNPTRGYLDPATVEQHRMLGQVRGYNQMYKPHHLDAQKEKPLYPDQTALKMRLRRARADGGDNMSGTQAATKGTEVACGDDDATFHSSDQDVYEPRQKNDISISVAKAPRAGYALQQPKIPLQNRRRHVPKDVPLKEEKVETVQNPWKSGTLIVNRRRPTNMKSNAAGVGMPTPQDDRPVVELFHKNRSSHSVHSSEMPRRHNIACDNKGSKAREMNIQEDPSADQLLLNDADETKSKDRRHPRRMKYRSRRYELPTVASQMKQAGVRYYQGHANQTNIPFIISKSTAPSHNIGVNIQQVLNGLKIQQPLSGIPLTIAHHMGLGHIPYYETKNVQPSLDHREINAIQLGRRLLRLPSYKYMSYNRLLSLYRESDGMVSRFLRAISRPHYFYTSMYNLATREDFDGATSTSKGRGGNQEAKQSLAEYATLYREYEQIDKRLKENHDPELERRKDELVRELAAREDHIRRVVQEYRSGNEMEQTTTLRASASTAEDGYRYSTFRLNIGDVPQ